MSSGLDRVYVVMLWVSFFAGGLIAGYYDEGMLPGGMVMLVSSVLLSERSKHEA